MDIELAEITVEALVEGYHDDSQTGGGVVGYSGKLDIRPPFQREFVYNDNQRAAVINTIIKGFPLNVMYWSDRGDGTYEIIDGQQRTISIAQYVEKEFSYEMRYFHNLPADKRDKILNYKLMVYICSGTDSEKLDWFKTINIAGAKLTNQELRNAVYAGSWVSDAKRYFSKTGGPAHNIGQDYMTGSPIRQEYLETVLKWISNDNIEDYMGTHQHDENAKSLWEYYISIINWIKAHFETRKSLMPGTSWGILYNDFKDIELDPVAIEKETKRLIQDDDVERKKGIYEYLLRGDEKHLNIRIFTDSIKQKVYEKQGGRCAICGDSFDISKMEADHIMPWSQGGRTIEENCQMLCKNDNRRKAAQ